MSTLTSPSVGDMMLYESDELGGIYYVIVNEDNALYETFCLQQQELDWVHKLSRVAECWVKVA